MPSERAARDIRDAYLLCSDAPDHVLAFWALAGHRGLLNELSKSRFKKERGDVRRKRCFRFEPSDQSNVQTSGICGPFRATASLLASLLAIRFPVTVCMRNVGNRQSSRRWERGFSAALSPTSPSALPIHPNKSAPPHRADLRGSSELAAVLRPRARTATRYHAIPPRCAAPSS